MSDLPSLDFGKPVGHGGEHHGLRVRTAAEQAQVREQYQEKRRARAVGRPRMSMHPVIVAASEFQKDEARREKRGQALRMPDLLAEAHLRASVSAIASTAFPQGIEAPAMRNARGELAVGIFGYEDAFDEQAATAITDILHAVAARGYSPQAVLNQAAAYYAEERTR